MSTSAQIASPSVSALIAISTVPTAENRVQFVANNDGAVAYRAKCESLKHKLPRQYVELRTAFEEFFSAIGGAKVCGACHSGKLGRRKEAHGCCGWCPNLSTERCVNKPLFCASFAGCDAWTTILNLGYIRTKASRLYYEFRRVEVALGRVRRQYMGFTAKDGCREVPHPYFAEGFVKDCEAKYPAAYCLALSRLTKRVKKLTDRVRSGELKFMSFTDYTRYLKDWSWVAQYTHTMEKEGQFISAEEYRKGPYA